MTELLFSAKRHIRLAGRGLGRRVIALFAVAVLLSMAGLSQYHPPVQAATTDGYCFDFRATAGYVADPSNCTYSIGGQYPQTRNGLTFGWTNTMSNTQDLSTSVDPRFAGVNSAAASAPNTFKVTLPRTGVYYIGVAMGDASSAQSQQYVQVADSGTVLTAMASASGPGAHQYYDLAGNLHTSESDFLYNQTLMPFNFTTTTMNVTIGKNGVGANNTIAYMLIYPAPTDTPHSSHYEFSQSSLGNSGLLQSSSAHYVLGESIGDTAIGNSASSNYQVNAGTQTTANPALTFTIQNGDTNFGSFSPTTTATATATFQVSDYTSYGYIVEITGDPPSNGQHKLPPMGTDAEGGPQAPTPGVEQFGVNLVANTVPSSLGADPDHGQFGSGAPTAKYAAANKFRYVDGDTIAQAVKSSGVTTYTISYIIDVGNLTPGGQYTSHQTLICIATY